MRHGRGRLGSHLLLSWLVVWLAAGPVRAAPARVLLPARVFLPALQGAIKPKLTVVFVGLDAKAKAQAGVWERAAEAAATASPRFNWVSLGYAASPAAAKANAQKLDDVQGSLTAGQKALEELDTAKASEHFGRAVQDLRELDLTQHWSTYVEALRRKAGNHATAGEAPLAKQELERLIAVSPKTELDPEHFPPDLMKYAESLRRSAVAGKAELTIRTEPPGANVWVDGQHRGQSPVVVSGLSNAKHVVDVVAGAYQLEQRDVSPGEELLRLKLGEHGQAWLKAVDQAAKDADGPGRDKALLPLAKAVRVDQLLVVIARKGSSADKLSVTALRLDAKDGHTPAYREGLVASEPAAAASFLTPLLDKDTPRRGGQPVMYYAVPTGPDPRMVGGFIAGGVGAAALLAGVTFGVLALLRQNSFARTPQVDLSASQTLKQQGKTFALVADISYVFALVGLGVGGTLIATSLLPTAEKDLSSDGDGDAEPPARKPKKPPSKRLLPDADADAGGDASKRTDELKKDDGKRREDERRKEEDRRKEDERRREEERRRDEERRKEDDRRRDDDRKKDDERRRREDEDRRRRDEEDRKRQEKERAKEEEDRRKRAAQEEAEQAKAEAERQKAEAERQKAEAARLRKMTPAERKKEEERKRLEEEEARRAEEEEDRKRIEDERRKREEQRRKKEEEERRRMEEDLRNQ